MMEVQNVLTTTSALNKKQFKELEVWWKDNHQQIFSNNVEQKLAILLDNHYIDFELKHIKI